jgi:hypothetical protein
MPSEPSVVARKKDKRGYITITPRLSESLYLKLVQEAQRFNMSVNQICQELLAQPLETEVRTKKLRGRKPNKLSQANQPS